MTRELPVPPEMGRLKLFVKPGLLTFPTSHGQLGIWSPFSPRTATLPAIYHHTISLITGEHSIDDILAMRATQGLPGGHGQILTCLATLHSLGALGGTTPDVDRFLERTSLPSGPKAPLLERISALLFLDLVHRRPTSPPTIPQSPGSASHPLHGCSDISIPPAAVYPASDGPEGAGTRMASSGLGWTLGFLVLGAVASGTYLLGVDPEAVQAALAPKTAVPGLLLLLLGLMATLSIKNLAAAAAVRTLGGRIPGWGLRLAFALPYLLADLSHYALLDSRRRITVSLSALAAAAMLPLVAFATWISTAAHWAGAMAIGGHIALLLSLSPLWRSEGAMLLAEATDTRDYRRRSRRYLLRKLWKDVFTSADLEPTSRTLIFVATVSIVYLLLLSTTLLNLGTPLLYAASSIAINASRIPLPARIASYLVAAALWLMLIYTATMLLAAAAAAVVRLLTPTAAARREPPPSAPPPPRSLDDIIADLAATPPFSGVNPQLVRSTVESSRLESHKKGSVIIRAGDPGISCYIVRSGSCSIHIEDASGAQHKVAVRGPGDLFGETALLTDLPRTATVTADSDVELLVVQREEFLAAVKASGTNPVTLTIHLRLHLFLKNHPLMRALAPNELAQFTQAVNLHRYPKDYKLIQEGDSASSMFLVMSGKLIVSSQEALTMRSVGPGEFVGELALLTKSARNATVIAEVESEVVEIPDALFQQFLAGRFAAGLMLDHVAEKRLASRPLI